MISIVIGGAGFIGSYIVESYLSRSNSDQVIVYDNLSSGKLWHLEQISRDPRLNVVIKDIYDAELTETIGKADQVLMLAANPDIAKAATEPDIDFREGTVLVQLVLEAMRKTGKQRLFYASGSGVYGDVGSTLVSENYSPMRPISTYGASKLGCEALISSYAYMFGIKATCFRFGNVVGGRQTHGVAYDFLLKLKANPRSLKILGDGQQSKPYIHISDVIAAIEITEKYQDEIFDVFNVAPSDATTVTEIADIVREQMSIPRGECHYDYAGGNRGWKGDVPIVRLDTQKIESLGWKCKYGSTEAVQRSVVEMFDNINRL